MTPARARLVALALAVVVTFLAVALLVARSPGELREAGDGLGAPGPLVGVVVVGGLMLALFPFPVSCAASGLLFGTALGTAVAVVGGTVGGTAAFLLARHVGSAGVAELAGERLTRLTRAVEERGFVAVLAAWILPGVPRTLANYAFGVTRVSVLAFVAATVLGMAPKAFAYTALGGSLDDLGSPEALVAFGLLVALTLLGVVLLREDLVGRLRRRSG